MTLIFSKLDADMGLFTGSDILTSAPSKYGSPAIDLPFQEKPLALVRSGYALRGHRQKTVLFGQTLIQWADSVLNSRTIVSRLFDQSNGGEDRVDLQGVIQSIGMNESQISQTSIIYHYDDGIGTIFRDWHNCSWAQANESGDVVGEGSGGWHFFDDVTAEGGTHPNKYLTGLISKVVSHAVYEFTGTVSLDYLYGGWFELATRGQGGRFRKIPYAIKLWGRNDGILERGGPIFFGFYDDLRLGILRLQPREAGGRVSHEQMLQWVPDFLDRENKPTPFNTVMRPEMITHIVIERDNPTQMGWTEGDPNSQEMLLEVSPTKGVHVNYSPVLRERLLALQPTDRDVKISHRFTER